MITVVRRFRLCSAHSLAGLPEGHKCANMHGHNYLVELEVGGALDLAGMVIDFDEIDAAIVAPLMERFDHAVLNERMDDNPTAENLAEVIAKLAGAYLDASEVYVESVTVWETDGGGARWTL